MEFALPKGKPWSREQTSQLIELRSNGKTVAEIANVMGKSGDAIKQKLRRLGLKVVTVRNGEGTTSTSEELILPEDLITVEEALLMLVAAMKALENPKLTKTDVMRLKTLIQSSTVYQKRLAEYMDYRKIERKLIQLDEKFQEHLTRLKSK